MSTIDDLNHFLETSERRRNISKRAKPNVKACKQSSTLGQRPTASCGSNGMSHYSHTSTSSSTSGSDAEEVFMKPTTTKAIQNNKTPSTVRPEFKKPPMRDKNKRRSKLHEFAVPRSKVKSRMQATKVISTFTQYLGQLVQARCKQIKLLVPSLKQGLK